MSKMGKIRKNKKGKCEHLVLVILDALQVVDFKADSRCA
jgi:hypothetical protein